MPITTLVSPFSSLPILYVHVVAFLLGSAQWRGSEAFYQSPPFPTPWSSTLSFRGNFHTRHPTTAATPRQHQSLLIHLSTPYIIVFEDPDDGEDGNLDDELLEDEEDDEDDVLEDPYQQVATSEFVDSNEGKDRDRGGDLLATSSPSSGQVATTIDWGGALGRLRERMGDVESGKSQDPSHALFRLMSSQSPNQAIGTFVTKANPQVVQAMSGAVGSLLGGLASPASGVEMVVKASGEKMGALCFQLQMTGYLFRNAEYILALRDLLKLSGSASLQDHKDAFDRLDTDNNGYIESHEVRDLMNDVYDGKVPSFEVDAFIRFFDQNKDGRVSWEEFERGLGAAMSQEADNRRKSKSATLRLLTGRDHEDDNGEEDLPTVQPEISGQIEIELEDGRKVKVEAKEYIQSLKEEARALKEALAKERTGLVASPEQGKNSVNDFLDGGSNGVEGGTDLTGDDTFSSITSYVASLQGDVKALTEGISPEIVDTMKLLVDYVLEGGESRKGTGASKKEELTMEIPGPALQQLALWQLILGYRLREAEAKGDYLKLLE